MEGDTDHETYLSAHFLQLLLGRLLCLAGLLGLSFGQHLRGNFLSARSRNLPLCALSVPP